jgi:hypothetical protein
VMITDRGRSYEAHSFSRVKQQKCLAHLQKTLSTLLEQKKGRAREFGENLKILFEMALDLWEEYHAGVVADFEARVAELRFAVSYQLRERALRDRDNQHLSKVLGRYHRRGGTAAFPRATGSGADEQPSGAGPAPSGNCQEGVPVLQELWRSLCFLRLRECDPDPGEVARWVSGGSTICPLPHPGGPVGPWLTPSRGQR